MVGCEFRSYHDHGASSRGIPAERFVIGSQNHDQVGNRLGGERLSQLVSYEHQKLAAALTLLSPFVPMLFMGEEYGETAPFLYFVSHGDEDLIESVRRGRREEFASFEWQGEIPDPQAVDTFERSRLNWSLLNQPRHRELWRFYQALIRLRRETPALRHLSKDSQEIVAWPKQQALYCRRTHGESEVAILFTFVNTSVSLLVPLPRGEWTVALDSTDPRWLGDGPSLPEPIHSEGEISLQRGSPATLVLVRNE